MKVQNTTTIIMIKIFQEDDTKKLTLSYNNLFDNDPLRTILYKLFSTFMPGSFVRGFL